METTAFMNVVQGNKAALPKMVPSTGLWVDRVRKWIVLSNHDTRDDVKQKAGSGGKGLPSRLGRSNRP